MNTKRQLLFAAWVLCATLSAQTGRTVQNLGFGWLFHEGDTPDAASITLDDSSWRRTDLPHDFQTEQPWVAPDPSERPDNTDMAANIKSRLSGRGFKEMGKAWYRYHLTPADSLKGRRLLLDFGGIMYVGDVFLNGEHIGGTDYGYVGFEIDVTEQLRFGQENVIAVLADTREPGNSRWYTGGGLFRTVRLVATSNSRRATRLSGRKDHQPPPHGKNRGSASVQRTDGSRPATMGHRTPQPLHG